ncbi:hypothetical protein pEaSNUABM37_00353 [Erwinia phage pEa_SNUABM_37]|nr:hypothetical protein pEaSNUABM37_00353 [Erwinia phage pEa_SNUABM_37]QXO10821.1 hypothetical protein pEaSNUABM48_00353 [Erwinia phage pEa_SNUABM_48]
MKLGYYYGLVMDNKSNAYRLLKIQRTSAGESSVAAYTRWIKELEQKEKGRYTTMGLSFGALKIEYNPKALSGVVKVGFAELGMITAKPSILSTAFKGVAGQTLYLSGKPNPLHSNTTLNEIRDAILEHIEDAIWVG